MPRAAFNKFVDVYFGPANFAGPPGALKIASLACRFVPYDQIFSLDYPEIIASAWVTYLGGPLTTLAGFAPGPGLMLRDFGQYDQMSDVPGGPPAWCVCYTEEVNPVVGAQYWRSRLIPLPLPF